MVTWGSDFTGQPRWTVGADSLSPRPWDEAWVDWVDMPHGRLHAVGGNGLLTGRAVCSALVILLDPVDWT